MHGTLTGGWVSRRVGRAHQHRAPLHKVATFDAPARGAGDRSDDMAR